MVESIPRKPCWVETRATRDWSDAAGALGMVGGGRVGVEMEGRNQGSDGSQAIEIRLSAQIGRAHV